MKRYDFDGRKMAMVCNKNGPYVSYDEASDLLQDERDKLARIEEVAQVALDNWPQTTLFSALKTVLQICKDGKASPITRPTGVEARVCEDIAERQQKGIAKYGTTLENNPLQLREWLQHMYEELLDGAMYAKKTMEELDK